ncbi:hypothetical protein OJ998_02155 [Solirubrobacter taibaiensis]|nr:hypothetical protein [Solirubrobacter taibaiensis]
MEFGVRLPLTDLGGAPTLAWSRSYVRAAAALDCRIYLDKVNLADRSRRSLRKQGA